jgi:hypothetical protein
MLFQQHRCSHAARIQHTTAGACDAVSSASCHRRPNPAAAESLRALFNQGRIQKLPPPPEGRPSEAAQRGRRGGSEERGSEGIEPATVGVPPL